MRRTFAASLLGLLLAACSSHGAQLSAPPQQHGGGLTVSVIKNASGVPQGVHVSWPLTADVAGYHLYRSPNSVPDSSKGDPGLWTQPGTIPQGGGATTVINYDDIFPVSVGETFFYRVSAVASDGDESRLSPESSITIAPFQVISLLTPSVPVDGFADISGLHFGVYDPVNDTVDMPGVEWQAGVGFSPVVLAPTIDQWDQDAIRVVVPIGATDGPLTVTISGVSQDTPEDFVNADPYLTGLTPLTANTSQEVTLTGNNFGNGSDESHRVVIDGVAIEDANYVSYTNNEIRFLPPKLQLDTDLQVRVLVNARLSNTGFLVLQNQPPTAELTATPDTGKAPLTVDFDASGSSDADGPIASYEWDWESDGTVDLNSGADPTVSHDYAVAGDFTATCTVTDSDGDSASDSVDLTVLANLPPTADLTASPTTGKAPLTVDFDASGSSDADGTITSYEWDWESDGTTDFNSGADPTVSHDYAVAGDFTATCTVTDSDGDSDSDSVDLTVLQNIPPTADLSANETSGEIPFEIMFDASGSSDSDGTIASYEWDWETDGTIDFNSGTDPTVSHVYTVAGDFTATCTVTDSDGDSDSDSVDLTFVDDMVVGLSYDPPGDYYAGDTITVNYNLSGGMAPYSLEWYVFDGDTPPQEVLIASDTGLSPGTGSHVFDLDTLSSTPVPGSNEIPLGQWQLHVVASDSTALNDGDPDLFIPRDDADVLGFYNVYRHAVGVIVDAQGDQTGAESQGLRDMLVALGYQVAMHTSDNLTLATIAGLDAVVWASAGPTQGRNPFTWLDQTDTTLLRSYLNTGKSAVVFGVPSRFSDTLFPDDTAFDQNYQPFDFCGQTSQFNDVDLHDFAAANDYTLSAFQMEVESTIGTDGGSTLLGGAVEADITDIEGGVSNVMAARGSATGGTLFFGMVTFSEIETVLPSGSTPQQLLDNIVDGSINN